MNAEIRCAMCMSKETTEQRIPFTNNSDIVIVNCSHCKRMIYARPEERKKKVA